MKNVQICNLEQAHSTGLAYAVFSPSVPTEYILPPLPNLELHRPLVSWQCNFGLQCLEFFGNHTIRYMQTMYVKFPRSLLSNYLVSCGRIFAKMNNLQRINIDWKNVTFHR